MMDTAALIDEMINKAPAWQGRVLKRLRHVITKADPQLQVEWKWNVPVWTKKGMVCAISGFKDHVKINFFNGAVLPDPAGLFNSGLDSKAHRSINLYENNPVNEDAIRDLVRAAVAYNLTKTE